MGGAIAELYPLADELIICEEGKVTVQMALGKGEQPSGAEQSHELAKGEVVHAFPLARLLQALRGLSHLSRGKLGEEFLVQGAKQGLQ